MYLGSGAWVHQMKVVHLSKKFLKNHWCIIIFLYRDLKTANILLDSLRKIYFITVSRKKFNWLTSHVCSDDHFSSQHNCAKLSDFGLAKDGLIGDKSHVSTRVMVTYGYAAPEHIATGNLVSDNPQSFCSYLTGQNYFQSLGQVSFG